MKRTITSLVILLIAGSLVFAQEEKKVPTFEEVLSLRSSGGPVISHDGKHVLFTQTQVDWEKNRYDTEIWISKDGKEPFQLSNNPEGNSSNPSWSPDREWIAFTSSRGNKNQVYVMFSHGGEAHPVTNVKQGVGGFDWSPDGKLIAFMVQEEKEKQTKEREDKFGRYSVEDNEFTLTRLWVVEFNTEILGVFKNFSKVEKLIDSVDFTVTGFLWSPDGKKIAFNHQPNPLINSSSKSDISIIDMETKNISKLVQNKGTDRCIAWSPDSKSILFSSSVDDLTSYYYKNSRYFRIDTDGKNQKELATDFDENLSGMTWVDKGIYATAYQKTDRRLFLLNPDKGSVKAVLSNPSRINSFSISHSGERIAFSAADAETLSEIFISDLANISPKKITSFSKQIENWKVSKSEVISWKSKDGAVIEGVLHKPMDYDPNKKYPLLVQIHGGPTGISTPSPAPAYVYPVLQWLDKGALVLMPNYRGSAGYGEEFRELNVENLGVGDAWDVISGIEYLDKKGLIDTDRMGSMGWSQGGYISAFLTTNSDIFKAISVGAGISNWMTYYVNTDIHPFTRQYLKATPWENEEVYRKTSPMTNINNASTPTLIQHGEFDQRVPIPNAYELYQGLQDVGVDAKLVVYKGFGHGITKPKERLAAIWHNWQWFGKYLWGEEIEIPKE
jgi:dipeptidyl aminopeptidase/acylaminoacyl peptidase